MVCDTTDTGTAINITYSPAAVTAPCEWTTNTATYATQSVRRPYVTINQMGASPMTTFLPWVGTDVTWTSNVGIQSATTSDANWVNSATSISVNVCYDNYVVRSPGDQLRKIIQERCAPKCIRKHLLDFVVDIRELRARQTLRRVIGEEKYFRYLKKGFVTARNSKSGLTYQIFPGHGITRVFENGKMIERLCVVLQGDFPPTDSLIVRYLLILNNEAMFREKAINHGVDVVSPVIYPGQSKQDLVQIFSDLKTRRAA